MGLLTAFLATLLAFQAALPAQSPPRTAAAWQHISYPDLEIPTGPDKSLTILVASGFRDGNPRLRFDVLWSGGSFAPPPDVLTKPGKISVRLHRGDGTVVVPENEPDLTGVGSRGMTWGRAYRFPWGRNSLDEAWFEFRIDDRTHWVEMPYGFTRDPSSPLASPEPNAGMPALAPAMEKLGSDDRIVPWLKIAYDLGVIQNGWRLLFEQANPFDAKCEVTLYREDSPWDLHVPKTSVHIVEDGGGHLRAEQLGVQRTDPFRRVDEYSFLRNPQDGRGWGTLTIAVDGTPWEAVIPSSLFKYTHGVAEPSHAQRIEEKTSR